MRDFIAVVNWHSKGQAKGVLTQLIEQPYSATTCAGGEFSCAKTTPHTPSIISDQQGYHLICNARIDNRAEILRSLDIRQPASVKMSDSEIILAAYKKWGDAVAGKLVGDFAFVIWNDALKQVYAARDFMNIHTLYFTKAGEELCLATSIQPLLNHPQLNRKINKTALAGWCSGWPDPDASLFSGIESLPAGHFITASASHVSVKKFWDIDPNHQLRYQQLNEYEEHLHELLNQSVTDRLRNDGSTIAAQMSGGMDSTSVTAFAHKFLNQQNRSLMTISHSYAATESCNETDLIKETAADLKLSNCHILPAETHLNLDFTSLYPPVIDSPGTVLSPRYIDEMELLKSAGANILLTGSGGDEICWGHSLTYGQRLKRGNLSVVPEVIRGCREMQLPVVDTLLNLFVKPLLPQVLKTPLKKILGKGGKSTLPLWASDMTIAMLAQEESIWASNSPQFKNPALQARYKALRKTSTLHSVRSYQQAASRYGIDVRHPFFDRRLAEFSFAIPDDLWLRDNRPKWLLRRVMTPYLPDAVCWNKQKVIFDAYFGNILKSQTTSIRQILSDTRLQEMGLIDNQQVIAAFNASINGSKASLNVDLLYTLLTQIWFQKYAHYFEGWG